MMKPIFTLLAVVWLGGALFASIAPARAGERWGLADDEMTKPAPVVATFSIVAFDPATGDLGVAVQSKFFGVGSVVPWAKAGVGAIATQSYANTTYGPEGLALLAAGQPAAGTLHELTRRDARAATRQVGIVDAQGRVASFTGTNCQAWAGHIEGPHFAAQGNILTGEEVVKAMAQAYGDAEKSGRGELGDWLMAALAAGQRAGGDKRGRQSAALLVVRERGGYAGLNDRYIDLRVEDHPEPIQELERLLALHKEFYRDAHAAKPVVSTPRPPGPDKPSK